MKKIKVSWKANTKLDKLIKEYNEEKLIELSVTFDNHLSRLKAEKKLDKILDMI